MIHRTAPSWQLIKQKDLIISDKQCDSSAVSWQQHLQQVITDPNELFDQLELNKEHLPSAIRASNDFLLKVPRPLLARIEKGNINDPILRQVLPIADELNVIPGYSIDPVGEQHNQPTGIIHKYHGRALFIVNGHCAVNCRYCFRRHFPYNENQLNRAQWEEAIHHIQQDTSISEIIYSGGDPLASSDKQLSWLTQQITAIPHVKRLRIHTRLPIVIPNRITSATLEWMTQQQLSTIVVLHVNHPNELNDATLRESILAMKSAGITVLNQAVLLKGVNDASDILIKLSEALFESGVLPYYLHVLDKVDGSAHFDITDDDAKELHQKITAQLPGYLVPKLVREVADKPSKIAI